MRLKWKMAAVSVISCAMFVSINCGSSSPHVRLVNALPSQSNLAMLIDGNNLAGSVAYGSASGYVLRVRDHIIYKSRPPARPRF